MIFLSYCSKCFQTLTFHP